MVVANGFYDRAGFVLLSDIFQHTSYGPWKRALVKVDREETFHLRHGERWMRTLAADAATHDELQAAVDWMFLMTLEWFGLPDDLKRHKEQLDYGLKGKTNDELRQEWMSTAVPFCESIGIDVPAHYDAAEARLRDRLSVPGPVRRAGEALAARGGRDHMGRGAGALAAARPGERGVRRDDPARAPPADGAGRLSTWRPKLTSALRSPRCSTRNTRSASSTWASSAASRSAAAVRVDVAYCSLGCPCIELIQDDIRERLLELDGVERVEVREVFDPGRGATSRQGARAPPGKWCRMSVGAGGRGRCSRAQDTSLPIRHIGRVDAATSDDAVVFARTLYEEWKWTDMFIVPRREIATVVKPA